MSKGLEPIVVRSPATAQARCGLASGDAEACVALPCDGALSEKLLVTVGLDAADWRRVVASRPSPVEADALDSDAPPAASPLVSELRSTDSSPSDRSLLPESVADGGSSATGTCDSPAGGGTSGAGGDSAAGGGSGAGGGGSGAGGGAGGGGGGSPESGGASGASAGGSTATGTSSETSATGSSTAAGGPASVVPSPAIVTSVPGAVSACARAAEQARSATRPNETRSHRPRQALRENQGEGLVGASIIGRWA